MPSKYFYFHSHNEFPDYKTKVTPMYVRTKTSPNTNKTTFQLIDGYRNEKGQPRQRIVQHIGMAETEEDIQDLIKIGEL